MKTIEERAKEYSLKDFGGYYAGKEKAVEEGYVVGATVQKYIDEEVRLKKCDDMTEAEHDREVAFAEWYHKNGNGMPTFSDAIEWAREKIIDKACSILEDMTEGRLGKRFISEFKNKLKYGVLERY